MVVGANTWVGVGTTVLGGVEIGFGTIVAAGSLLRTSVPPLCLVAGHPARIIKTFDWLAKAWVALPTDEAARAAALSRHVQGLPSEAAYLDALVC
jgi:serine acetyltransferase